jgi:hypothetical protein
MRFKINPYKQLCKSGENAVGYWGLGEGIYWLACLIEFNMILYKVNKIQNHLTQTLKPYNYCFAHSCDCRKTFLLCIMKGILVMWRVLNRMVEGMQGG